MQSTKRVLFICEGNLHRSPTAARLYSQTPGIKTRSAGLSPLARVQLTEELLVWADVVFVMEKRLGRLLRKRFPDSTTDVVSLGIPDDYQFGEPDLLRVLEEKLAPHLGPPTSI